MHILYCDCDFQLQCVSSTSTYPCGPCKKRDLHVNLARYLHRSSSSSLFTYVSSSWLSSATRASPFRRTYDTSSSSDLPSRYILMLKISFNVILHRIGRSFVSCIRRKKYAVCLPQLDSTFNLMINTSSFPSPSKRSTKFVRIQLSYLAAFTFVVATMFV